MTFVQAGLIMAICSLAMWVAAYSTRLVYRLSLSAGAALPVLILLPWLNAEIQPPHPTPKDRTAASDSPWTRSNRCQACHPSAYASWHQSYHRTMTQEASPDSVIARWEGSLHANNRDYHLLRDGDRFLVDMPAYGTTGEASEDRRVREVVMTTGSHHMQIFWVPSPWSDDPLTNTGHALFNTHCSSCHGLDGHGKRAPIFVNEEGKEIRAGPLAQAELTPPELADALKDARHIAMLSTPLTTTQSQAILRYVERIQVYGSLQQFPFAWWVRDGQWFHEEHTFLQPPPETDEIEFFEQHWSNNCDECHSVAPIAHWSDERGELDAEVAELGIACEACHGPASAHADHYQLPNRRYGSAWNDEPAFEITNPGTLDHEASSAICGQCHGELVFPSGREQFSWTHGERLEDHAKVVQRMEPPYPDWLEDTLEAEPDLLDAAFWRDGTMRVAGRDYNAMVLSGCYTDGEMSCISCHQLHGSEPDDQLRGGHRGDGACSECHPAEAAQGSAHTHHAPSSEGSRCMNCHMPHTTIGLLGAMRSHRIDSPSASTAYETGRPDACSLCHLDKPLSWSEAALTEWYGQPPIETVRYTTKPPSAAVEWLLRGDAAQRALIAWHMGWAPAQEASDTDWMVPYLSLTLQDPYSAVRYIAGASLKTLPDYADIDYNHTHDKALRQKAVDWTDERWGAMNRVGPRPAVLMREDGTIDTAKMETYLLVRDNRDVSVSE